MAFNSYIDNSDLHYIYDGSFYGLLTVIFTAVYSRKIPFKISPSDSLQLSFNAGYIDISSDKQKAERVLCATEKKLGRIGMRRLYYVFLSDNSDKEMIIYKYIMLGLKNGAHINSALSDDTISAAFKYAENVSREAEKFRQFLRFNITDNGIQYARFAPKNNLLPIITPFFVRRLKGIPFLIHDVSHDLCSIYDKKSWYVTSSEGIKAPEKSNSDKEMNLLWKTFFDTIAIKERENHKLQQQNMPSRYFRDIWSVK